MRPVPSLAAVLVALAPLFAAMAAPPLAAAEPRSEAPATAAASDQARKGSGLPVPRFASMRSDEVNVRAGPGTRYPVEWVFQRRNMPVEVVAEFDTWRRIRDWQGTTGWVHQSMLVGKRNMVVTAPQAALLRTPEPGAAPVARLEAAVQGEILSCKGGWCRIRVQNHRGWIERAAIWGVYPDETLD